MATLILAIFLAIGILYFSIQNTYPITVTLANYPLTDIPLYLIVIISVGIGLFVGFIINIFQSLSTFFSIHGKDAAVRNANNTIASLKEKLKDAQIENKQLREDNNKQYYPSYFTRLRHNVGL